MPRLECKKNTMIHLRRINADIIYHSQYLENKIMGTQTMMGQHVLYKQG